MKRRKTHPTFRGHFQLYNIRRALVYFQNSSADLVHIPVVKYLVLVVRCWIRGESDCSMDFLQFMYDMDTFWNDRDLWWNDVYFWNPVQVEMWFASVCRLSNLAMRQLMMRWSGWFWCQRNIACAAHLPSIYLVRGWVSIWIEDPGLVLIFMFMVISINCSCFTKYCLIGYHFFTSLPLHNVWTWAFKYLK